MRHARLAAGVGVLCCGLAAAGIALTALPGPGAADAVRPAARAGRFYPGSARELRRDVAGLLEAAAPQAPDDVRQMPLRAIVVPHAGFIYSGPTAALAYKLLEGTPPPKRVVLLGPSHYAGGVAGCTVADYSAYRTPLGPLPVDAKARDELTASGLFRPARTPHEPEHCLEVQLPFIQCLWTEPPPIVPVLTGSLSEQSVEASAAGLARVLADDSLLVVSTDFTHHGPRYGYVRFADQSGAELRDSIRALDMEGVELLKALDTEGFARYMADKRPTICGRMGLSIMARLFAEAPGARVVFLGWANSGERAGYRNCVSYVAMAVYASDEAMGAARETWARHGELHSLAATPRDPPELRAADRRTLLALARGALERSVRAGSVDAAQSGTHDVPETLSRLGGAFVTLKINGHLRGCVGHIAADRPMAECVERMAGAAALRDPRFRRVRPEELDRIKLQISVLGPLEPLPSPDDVEVGRDGLLIRAAGRSGLLLPQVAVEKGWDREEFLRQTCVKARLPADAWQADGVQILRFTATVFGEE